MPRLSKVLTRALVPQFTPRLAALSRFVFVAMAFAIFWFEFSLAWAKLSFVIEVLLPPLLKDWPKAY